MKNLVLLFALNILSSLISAMRKDSLKYKNTIEFTYQRNYSYYKIVSYYHKNMDYANERIKTKESNESAIYTNIIALFYTFRIKPWIYVRSGFSTGTIGNVSNPELKPIYMGAGRNVTIIGYEKVSELFPTTFLNLPIQLGFQKKIYHTSITPYVLIGFEGLSIKSPFLKSRSYESFQNSSIYRFRLEKDFDLSNAKKDYYTTFNFISVSTGFNFDLKALKLGFYYQYRGGKKYQNNINQWMNLNIVERKFAHAIGLNLGYNF